MGVIAPKATKEQAHYRLGTAGQHCAQCTMFVRPDGCTSVQGKISPWAVCDFFKKKETVRS